MSGSNAPQEPSCEELSVRMAHVARLNIEITEEKRKAAEEKALKAKEKKFQGILKKYPHALRADFEIYYTWPNVVVRPGEKQSEWTRWLDRLRKAKPRKTADLSKMSEDEKRQRKNAQKLASKNRIRLESEKRAEEVQAVLTDEQLEAIAQAEVAAVPADIEIADLLKHLRDAEASERASG